ncbi:hypothetical protein C8R41DRAFT_866432, partial [Lentinula lateritia]
MDLVPFPLFHILLLWFHSVSLPKLRVPFRTLQILTDDSPSTESPEVYDVFEEAAPFLVYIRDFWIGRTNCPLFTEQVLLSAESLSLGLPIFLRDNLVQQWGVPPEHRSSAEGVHSFERFPAIPIPFCLRFREGSAMMRMVPSKDLDPFASLRGQVSSPRSTRSRESDNELLSAFPSAGSVPRASSSTKVSIGGKELKSKTTVKVVEDSKASNPPPAGKVRQIVATDDDSTSKEVESEDEEEDEEEDSAPPSKRPKTTSSIS